MKRIYAASSNPGKLKEFALAAAELGLVQTEVLPLPGLKGIRPPEETGLTFEENSSQKAVYYSQFTSEVVLVDDSGLEVEALDWAPGIRSARYAGATATATANNRLLLENLRDCENRTARFVCAVTLAQKGTIVQTARGLVYGSILRMAKGDEGFGYDPLFFYPPFSCSFGELNNSRKFLVSHRGQALRQIFKWLADQGR